MHKILKTIAIHPNTPNTIVNTSQHPNTGTTSPIAGICLYDRQKAHEKCA